MINEGGKTSATKILIDGDARRRVLMVVSVVGEVVFRLGVGELRGLVVLEEAKDGKIRLLCSAMRGRVGPGGANDTVGEDDAAGGDVVGSLVNRIGISRRRMTTLFSPCDAMRDSTKWGFVFGKTNP